jgi:RecG-like helicase
MFDVANLLGKRVLIVGDVGSGKTVLTLKIVYGLIDLGFGGRISILDFAPNLMKVY